MMQVTTQQKSPGAHLSQTIQVKRMEPPCWWIGMHQSVVQVMVYGQQVALCKPVIQHDGVLLERVERTDNADYLFLYLKIAPNAHEGSCKIAFVLQDESIAAMLDFPLHKRDASSSQRESFDSSDTIYLIMPDRFSFQPQAELTLSQKRKMARERKLEYGRHGGNLDGIRNHLDYLQNLGVTALWLTPLLTDAEPTYSYHHYAIGDYYHIDPRFGTNEDYRLLVHEAHERGIKLIMDVVVNHCGLHHWWMNNLPAKDWVNPKVRCNYRPYTITDPYASADDRRLNEEGWFDDSMPDLNLQQPLLMDYMVQNTIWWMEYAGVSGLRIDTYPYVPKHLMAIFNQRIRAEYPLINIVGECWMHESVECAYWQEDACNPDGFNSHLPSVMDFPLNDVLREFVFRPQGWLDGVVKLYTTLSKDYLYPKPHHLLLLLDNHDMDRVWSALGGDDKGNLTNMSVRCYRMLFCLLMTLRGIPQVYYGTEIGMCGKRQWGDGNVRKDFPGGWPNDRKSAFEEQGRTKRQQDIFDFTRRLLLWRKHKKVIHHGKMMHYIPENECYVFFRYDETETVMVALNNHDTESRTLQTLRFHERMEHVDCGFEVTTGQLLTGLDDKLVLPPKTCYVIELGKKKH